MNVSEYYVYQAKARGLNSVPDVLKIVAENTLLYDQIVLPWLPADRNCDIYEAGCGTGIFLHWLKLRGFANARGTDSSEAQISLAAAGGVRAELADSLLDLQKYPSGSFDCLVALDVYEHLPKESLLDFISDALRVLRPGGRLIMRGPNGDSPVVGRALFNDITHYWALTSTAFNAILQMVGFSRVEFKDDTLAGIHHHRWLKVPLAWIAQRLLRILLGLATRENIRCLSASMFLCAWK